MSKPYMIVEPGRGDTFGPHCPLLAIADGEPTLQDNGDWWPAELGVQVDANGDPNGLRSDGVKGLSEGDVIAATNDDSPMCVCCNSAVSRWG